MSGVIKRRGLHGAWYADVLLHPYGAVSEKVVVRRYRTFDVYCWEVRLA